LHNLVLCIRHHRHHQHHLWWRFGAV